MAKEVELLSLAVPQLGTVSHQGHQANLRAVILGLPV